jgi:putative nucleotidyltransferase with HDIG domain
MPCRAKAYILSMGIAGAAVLGYGLWNWHSADWARYLFYLALSAVASGLKVTLSAGAGTMSLNFLFILIGIESLSLGETLVIGCLGILIQRFFHAHERPTAVQVAFNVASIALATAAAFAAYRAGLRIGRWFEPPALLLAAGTFFFANTFSVAMVIALTRGTRAWSLWRQSYCWSFPNYLLGAAVAWGLGAVSDALGWQVSVLLMPVLYVLYRSYRLYVDRLEEERRHAEEQRAHAQQLAALHRRTIETLAVAVEAKDRTTYDHLARVEVYALAIGRELGLSEQELKALEAAALLHDIGKVAVPESLISKPGKLTRAEFERMKIHPVVGAELVEQVGFPYPVAPIVRAHHERWDGNGYPDGLAGEDIPIGARILSVVDSFDALASDRQYRRALPLEQALAEIRKEAGKSYDPRVVEILSRRCAELEREAKASAMAQRAKLSTNLRVRRGAAPAAGFEESADSTASDLVKIRNSIEAARAHSAGPAWLDWQSEAGASRRELFAELSETLGRAIPYQALVVYLRRGDALTVEYLDGESQNQFAPVEIPVGAGLAGWVAEHGTAIVNGDPLVEPGYLHDPARSGTLGSALAAPLESPEGVTGVLALYRRERDAFAVWEMRLLVSIAARAACSLDLAARA